MIWNPGDGSDLNEGGTGIDTVEVNGGNGTEAFLATVVNDHILFERVDPAPFSIDIGTSESLVVNMNGGDDSFSANGNIAGLIVDGGAGDDTIFGGDGNDLLIGGDGNDFIDGNQGIDRALLGAGDDFFRWDPGDGSDTVEGQAGRDTMIFNGTDVKRELRHLRQWRAGPVLPRPRQRHDGPQRRGAGRLQRPGRRRHDHRQRPERH